MVTIVLKEFVASDLALRDSADRLFDNVESVKSMKVTLDFAGIESITRSFAHQYRVRKESARKQILETNVPTVVSRMFVVVAASRPKTPFVDIKAIKVIGVNPV
ncbi:DUF4325 domain-containing protein [Candidatus Micrarchaeota archaeon]|nr:DUF4325 domain-containing protein [Candidatus Micrarchaeota archaeon]